MLTPRLAALAALAALSLPAQAQENVVQTFQSVFVNGLICFTSNGCMLVKNVPAVLFSKEIKDKDDPIFHFYVRPEHSLYFGIGSLTFWITLGLPVPAYSSGRYVQFSVKATGLPEVLPQENI